MSPLPLRSRDVGRRSGLADAPLDPFSQVMISPAMIGQSYKVNCAELIKILETPLRPACRSFQKKARAYIATGCVIPFDLRSGSRLLVCRGGQAAFTNPLKGRVIQAFTKNVNSRWRHQVKIRRSAKFWQPPAPRSVVRRFRYMSVYFSFDVSAELDTTEGLSVAGTSSSMRTG